MMTQIHLKGAGYMVGYAASQSAVWALVRHLGMDYPTTVLFFFRTLLGAGLLIPIVLLEHRGFLRQDRDWGVYILRASAAFVGGISLFFAVSHAPLASVVAITFSAPIIASLLAVIFFGETMGRRQWTTTAICFLGMGMVLRPTSFAAHLAGTTAAIVGAFATAVAFLCVKKLAQNDAPSLAAFISFVMILPLSAVIAAREWTTPQLNDWVAILSLGGGFLVGQIFLANALKSANASSVLQLDFLRLIFTAALGAILFAEAIDLWTIVGGAMILLAALLSTVRRKSSQNPAASNKVTT